MQSESSVPSIIGGCHVFPVSLPPQRALPISATHYMYLKPHEPKIPDAVTPRSLFVINVPFDSTALHLKHLFSAQIGLPAGRIVDVEFIDRHEPYSETLDLLPKLPATASSRKRKREQEILENLPPLDATMPPLWDRKLYHPGTNAVVVFVDKTSMEAALKAARRSAKDKAKIVWGDGVEDQLPALGSARYLRHAELMYPDPETISQISDRYLEAYDAHIAARDRLLAEQRQMPDEDGFVMVSRSSGKGATRGVKQDAAKERLAKQKKKQGGFTDFYRFQGREQAKQKAKELVAKFQDDVEKVKQIRQSRGRLRPD